MRQHSNGLDILSRTISRRYVKIKLRISRVKVMLISIRSILSSYSNMFNPSDILQAAKMPKRGGHSALYWALWEDMLNWRRS